MANERTHAVVAQGLPSYEGSGLKLQYHVVKRGASESPLV